MLYEVAGFVYFYFTYYQECPTLCELDYTEYTECEWSDEHQAIVHSRNTPIVQMPSWGDCKANDRIYDEVEYAAPGKMDITECCNIHFKIYRNNF